MRKVKVFKLFCVNVTKVRDLPIRCTLFSDRFTWGYLIELLVAGGLCVEIASSVWHVAYVMRRVPDSEFDWGTCLLGLLTWKDSLRG